MPETDDRQRFDRLLAALSSRTPQGGEPGRQPTQTSPPGSCVSSYPGDGSGRARLPPVSRTIARAISGRPKPVDARRPGSPLCGVRDDKRHSPNAIASPPQESLSERTLDRPQPASPSHRIRHAIIAVSPSRSTSRQLTTAPIGAPTTGINWASLARSM